jgi:hypothetical protein
VGWTFHDPISCIRAREFVQLKKDFFPWRYFTLSISLTSRNENSYLTLKGHLRTKFPLIIHFILVSPCLSSFSLSFPITREDMYFKFYESKLIRFRCVIRASPSNFVSINTNLPWVLFWFTVCWELQCESGRFDSNCQRVPTNFVIQLQLDAKCRVTLCHEFT